ncbi:hypothetical protein M378DRAFT_132811, partial [Amanita muscaria Koide BX008]
NGHHDRTAGAEICSRFVCLGHAGEVKRYKGSAQRWHKASSSASPTDPIARRRVHFVPVLTVYNHRAILQIRSSSLYHLPSRVQQRQLKICDRRHLTEATFEEA